MYITPYQMCINNAASYIQDTTGTENCIDAFTFSSVLSICFCKDKEEIIHDIVGAACENLKQEIGLLKNNLRN